MCSLSRNSCGRCSKVFRNWSRGKYLGDRFSKGKTEQFYEGERVCTVYCFATCRLSSRDHPLTVLGLFIIPCTDIEFEDQR